jgi:hypothetical protein
MESEHGNRGIAVVNIRYQATANEVCKRQRRHSVIVCHIVICEV